MNGPSSEVSILLIIIILFILIYYVCAIHSLNRSNCNRIGIDKSSSFDGKKAFYERDLTISKYLQDTYRVLISIQFRLSDPIERTIPFILHGSSGSAKTVNKREIHLIVWNNERGTPFDRNTVRGAAIHELAHIICPDSDHTSLFDDIEDELIGIAEKLDYYNSSISPDPDYPCIP